MSDSPDSRPDSDIQKGAVESDRPGAPSDESLGGQLGHRDPALKDNDTDFPEPDAQAEHSGHQK